MTPSLVENVREGRVNNDHTPDVRQSDELSIISIEEDYPRQFEELPAYPFPNQKIFRGRYEYKSSPQFGSPESAKGDFQLRTESGLILLSTDKSRPKPKTIFRALNNVLNGKTEINRSFVPNQENIWEFVEEADERHQVKAITPTGQIMLISEIDAPWEEVRSRYPLELALLSFYRGDEEIKVRYHDDRIEISPPTDINRDYIIQIFESIFASKP